MLEQERVEGKERVKERERERTEAFGPTFQNNSFVLGRGLAARYPRCEEDFAAAATVAAAL